MICNLFNRVNSKDKYILHDSWEPSFSAELELAVSSFYADAAFHRSFGSEKFRLDKDVVTDYFAGLVMSSRCMPGRYVITVRRKNVLVAFIVGSINCGEGALEKLNNAIRDKKIVLKNKYNLNKIACAFHEARHKRNAKLFGAAKDTEFEFNMKKYIDLLGSAIEVDDIFFTITMIAVHPEEQRQGHFNNMFEQLKKTLAEIQLLTYIRVYPEFAKENIAIRVAVEWS